MPTQVILPPMSKEPTNQSDPPSERSCIQKKRQIGQSVFVRDCIIGFADGLTVPFALTAGLSALGQSRIAMLGGLAELFAGSISMGLGAYLAAVTERKHYEVEECREWKEIKSHPQAEEDDIFDLFDRYGVAREDANSVVNSLKVNEDLWIQFIMDFKLRLEKPAVRMAWIEGLVMGVSYFFGGLLPMIPYFAFQNNVYHALFTSIGVTAIVLLAFGYVKALVTGTTQRDAAWSALQTLTVGALAAAVSYGIVRGVNERLGWW